MPLGGHFYTAANRISISCNKGRILWLGNSAMERQCSDIALKNSVMNFWVDAIVSIDPIFVLAENMFKLGYRPNLKKEVTAQAVQLRRQLNATAKQTA